MIESIKDYYPNIDTPEFTWGEQAFNMSRKFAKYAEKPQLMAFLHPELLPEVIIDLWAQKIMDRIAYCALEGFGEFAEELSNLGMDQGEKEAKEW